MPKFRDVVYGITPEISAQGKELVTAEWVLFKAKGIMPERLVMNGVAWTTISDDYTEATLDLSKTTLIADWGTPETFFNTYIGIELLYFNDGGNITTIPADGETTDGYYLEGQLKVTRNGDILTFKAHWHWKDSEGNEIPYPIFDKTKSNYARGVVWHKNLNYYAEQEI